MTNLPKPLRADLPQRAALYTTQVARVQESEDGTAKLLVELPDGEAVEAVTIPEGRRRTVCISTQVGCPVGCVFCASGMGGRTRDLTPGEVLEQVLHARRWLRPAADVTHVVVMGVGEPLANYDALVRALHIFVADWGLALGSRRITVSTIGLPDRIRALAAEDLGVQLAVSLHAADDATRRRLVPGARPASEVLAAAREFAQRTGRGVTIEVVLVQGVNDSVAHARRLADRVGDLPEMVNLIPLNPVPGLPCVAPPPERVHRFAEELRRRGLNARERRRRGADIAAACGQLRQEAAGPTSPREKPPAQG
jgi:23S rRNA (adenine2503-C2)-methyltransferase